MSAVDLAFDGLLALGLLWFAWSALTSRSLFKAVVMMIAYGLLMALTWARLGAVDIALAEAAIGAGVTGALLLDVVGHISERRRGGGEPAPASQSWGEARFQSFSVEGIAAKARKAATVALLFALAGALIWSLMTLPEVYPGLQPLVSDHLTASGVDNPVTAVLLNFRAYDTLLEVGVLLLAVVGIAMMRREQLTGEGSIWLEREQQVHGLLTRALVPVMLLISGYLLWAGTVSHGGAFQGGAILGAAGILMVFGRVLHRAKVDGPLARGGTVLGFAAFFVIGVAVMPVTGAMFAYPEGWAYDLIFLIEALLTLSIGVALALFYAISAREPGGAE